MIVEDYVFELAISLGIGTIVFFLKRTLNNITSALSKNDKKIRAIEDDFNSHKVEQLQEMQEEFREQTKSISNLVLEIQTNVTNQISAIEEKHDSEIKEVKGDLKSVVKELNEFKAYIGEKYTRQEDFASQTRDINKKLDDVYGGVQELKGILSKNGGDSK